MKTIARTAAALVAAMLLASRGQAETTNSQAILNALNENHDRMVQAFIDRDAEQFASCWTPDAVCAVDELPLIRGREQLCSVFMDAVGGASMHGLERLNRRIWQSGDMVYETGVYVHRFAVTGQEQVRSSAKDFLTVWEKQSDGGWKRAAEAWNNRPEPSAELLAGWRKQTKQDIPVTIVNGLDATGDGAFEKLAALEQTFHAYFLTDDVEPAIDMYTDDARLLSGGPDWLVGKEQIRKRVMDSRKQVTLVDIDCEVVASGGDGRLAYVVNRFHWQFKPVGEGDRIYDYFGKGMHIWQHQPDGQWKILIDINSMNPSPGVSP